MPILDGWQSRGRPSLQEVLEWAAKGNLGLRTGRLSKIIVIDEDKERGGCIELYGDGELPPTWTVETGGGGRHYYFAYPEAGTFGNTVGRIGPHIDTRGDRGQVVFVGSIHPTTGKIYEWADGRSPDDVELSPLPEWVISALSSTRTRRSSAGGANLHGLSRYASSAVISEVERVKTAEEGSRNNVLNEAAFNLGQLVGGDQLPETLVRVELEEAGLIAGLELHEIRATIQSGLTAGSQHPRGAPDPAAVTTSTVATISVRLPEVLIPGSHVDENGAYHEVGTDDFARSVLASLPDGLIYRRMTTPGEIVGERGQKYFRELTVAATRMLVDENVRLIKWVKKRNDDTAVRSFQPCTTDLASLLIDYAGRAYRIRELHHLTRYPVFIGSGFALSAAGWNDLHGVYYDEPDDLVGIELDYETEAITALLGDLVVDFPFKDEASRQNFFGLMLTPLCRPAIGENVPLHLIQSPLERTGKTKLAGEVFGTIIDGKPLPALQLGGHDDEIDKRITSILLSGSSLVHIDNIREFLDSASLAALLTSREYQGRLLGKSKDVKSPNNTTIVATGNNVRATGEIAKRTVPIILQPTTDTPEDRNDFRHPELTIYLSSIRKQIVCALCSMVHRWATSQRVVVEPPKGGFERWSRIIGGILKMHGYYDWRRNERAWTRISDPNGEDLRTFVQAWHDKHAFASVSTSELVDLAEALNVFPASMKHPTQRGRQIAFSRMVLGKNLDAPVGEFVIRASGSGNGRYFYLEELSGHDYSPQEHLVGMH